MTDATETLAERRLDKLMELADIGLTMARALGDKAETAGAEELCQHALAYTRVARAVRLTIALHARLELDPGAFRAPRAERAEAQIPAASAEDAEKLEERRRTGQVRRAMTRFIAQTAIEAGDREASEVETLLAMVDQRLDRDHPDVLDFEHVDVKQLAYSICLDLGVDPGPDWWLEGWGVEVAPVESFP